MTGLEQAQEAIKQDGAAGYKTAAKLVGPNKTDELLADLIRNNMRIESHTPTDGEVESIVAKVRKSKGF